MRLRRLLVFVAGVTLSVTEGFKERIGVALAIAVKTNKSRQVLRDTRRYLFSIFNFIFLFPQAFYCYGRIVEAKRATVGGTQVKSSRSSSGRVSNFSSLTNDCI